MKIAFVVSEFPSVSQTFILNQITGLLDMGHHVEIFAGRKSIDNKVHDDVIAYRLIDRTHYFMPLPRGRMKRVLKGCVLAIRYAPQHPRKVFNMLNWRKLGRSALDFSLFYKAIPFLENGKFDLFQCHFGPQGKIAATLKKAGVIEGTVFTAFHGFDLTTYIRKTSPNVYQALFAHGDLFMPISVHWKKKLIDVGCDEHKILVHRMGIDIKKIHAPKKAPLDKNHIKLLSVARLVEKKGIEYGIKAVKKLQGHFAHIEYVIIGDGPLKEDLQKLIEALGLTDSVYIIGWQTQDIVYEYMRQSDIFLAPSVTSATGDKEGIPIVLMEAMAHGMPLVSSLHSGIPELVKNGDTGFLVNEKDSAAIARKIACLIADRGLALQMGSQARRVIENEFNVDRLNARLIETYRQYRTSRPWAVSA